MRIIRKAKEGFTLVELMIVVAIVGVLAVLAVYGVRKYIANSKTAEARNSLGQISKDAATAYERETFSQTGVIAQAGSTATLRAICDSEANPIPNGITDVQGKKYQSSPGDWSQSCATVGKGFCCLKYSMDAPQYYMYNYQAANTGNTNGATFTASATGDLDGNGSTSYFSIQGATSNAVLNIAPTIGEVNPEE